MSSAGISGRPRGVNGVAQANAATEERRDTSVRRNTKSKGDAKERMLICLAHAVMRSRVCVRAGIGTCAQKYDYVGRISIKIRVT